MTRECSARISVTAFRDECLNEHWLFSLAQAHQTIEDWRRDYTTIRPHSEGTRRPLFRGE